MHGILPVLYRLDTCTCVVQLEFFSLVRVFQFQLFVLCYLAVNMQYGIRIAICRLPGFNHWFGEVWRAHLDLFGGVLAIAFLWEVRYTYIQCGFIGIIYDESILVRGAVRWGC